MFKADIKPELSTLKVIAIQDRVSRFRDTPERGLIFDVALNFVRLILGIISYI